MKLHANAALSLTQRRGWCVGWSSRAGRSDGRRGRRRSVARTCCEVGVSLPGRGESGLLDRCSAPERVAQSHRRARIEAIAALRRLADSRAGDRRAARHGALDGVGDPDPDRAGPALAARAAGAGRALRARAPGRAGPHRRQEARAHPGRRRASACATGYASTTTRAHRRRGDAATPSAGTTCTLRSTTPRAWPTPKCSPTRRPRPRSRSSAARSRSTPRHGIRVERVMTDNGSAYRAPLHALACRALGIRHLRTRPYRPQTNGKAERFIRTMLAGWAYGAIYGSSRERTAALDGWLWTYNHPRGRCASDCRRPRS